MYNELIQEYPKWTVLNLMGKEFQVNASTIEFWLFPQRKRYQKNFGSKRWHYERENPKLRRKITDYKAKYMNSRNHIDEHIQRCFEQSTSGEALTLDYLAECIHEKTDIHFHPKTILGLVKRYEAEKGRPLLKEIVYDDGPRYVLHKDANE